MAFLDRVGIANDVTKKSALAFTGEEAVQKVVTGDADITIAFVSEILPVKGAKWLGPIPAALQIPTDYAVAIGAGSAHPDIARALIDELTSAESRRVIREAGLEPIPRR